MVIHQTTTQTVAWPGSGLTGVTERRRLIWLDPDLSRSARPAPVTGAFVSERRVSIYIVEITRAGGGIAPLASG